ncbi:MAG: C-terminal binding protein [Firmicutes bacterium]|nr:C-terminal binding protein [Bacillota bacterium]
MAKYKVVITDREYETIDNEKRVFEESGLDIELYDYQYKDKEHILEVAKDADAIIVQYAKMPRDLIEELDKCKIIARYATGFDGLDLEAATDNGIYICNVNDYCREEVATHTLALLMEMTRRVSKYDDWTHDGNWYAMPGKQHSLRNQVIGVISFGRIARAFIDRIKPLCDNIWVYDAYADPEAMRSYGVEPKSFEEIVEHADYISMHCPLTEDTRHMFNKDVFKKMKNTAVIINVARGPVVSQDDLVWALENKEIGGAALDVLEQEPPAKDNPLFGFDNVIVTPHTAWYSVESQAILQSTPAEEVVRVLKGEVPLNVVNKDILKK